MNQHYNDYLGGSEIQCDIIAKNMILKGHKVFYGAIDSLKTNYEVNYEVIPLRKISFQIIAKIFKGIKPDIVYWRYNKNYLLVAGILCWYYRIKLVFAITSISDTKRYKIIRLPEINKLKIKKRIRSLMRVVKVFMLSFINSYGCYFVNGATSVRKSLLINLSSFRKKVPKVCIYDSMETKLSEKFKWKKPYVIWVANLKKIKNPELFLNAARKFVDKNVDFIMVGKIQDDVYEYFNDKNEFPPNLFYLGPKKPEEVNSMIRGSLFLVHTCNPEGFPNNYIQAWMQGRPTIALYFDPDSIIENNNIGYYSKNFDRMCNDINNLIEDKRLREEMGNNARKIAVKLFDPEKNMLKLNKFFEDVLKIK
jgi:glycosyltransferase involved in cell wall biosynthesis